ncbi:avidin/streptavidin family protein [Kitasatospora sp. NPDC085895]|uniref:avidin/streptavidin family protein n=1 Tax=Kitasatospora sp. NPDC085895 TaxID=3155057 RepID=UPI00344FE924
MKGPDRGRCCRGGVVQRVRVPAAAGRGFGRGADGCLRAGCRSGGPAGAGGAVRRVPDGAGHRVGGAVVWRDEHGSAASVTSWSGQYFPGEERIVAGWLFTTVTEPGDAWKATAVGRDTFRRAP